MSFQKGKSQTLISDMEKKILCIYHVVDADGIFSALTVNKWCKENGFECVMIGWTYGNPDPTFEPGKYDQIFLVDIMLNPDIMQQLHNQYFDRITWLDHHIGNITVSQEKGYSDFHGVRKVGIGAVEITWEYLFKTSAPKFIRLISAYDVWNHERFPWDTETSPLQLGLRSEKYGISVDVMETYFNDLLIDKDGIIESIIEIGLLIDGYVKKQNTNAVKSYAFPVLIKGKYRGICCFTTSFGSRLFDSVKDQYQVYVCINFRNGVPSISVYQEEGASDLNLAEFMLEHNGGGHKNAAGGTLTREQFLKLIDSHILD